MSGLASACAGLGSGGLGSGGLGAGAFSAVATISGFSTIFGAGSFMGFTSSATLSTIGLGASALGAVFDPAMICENSASEIMSTATDSAAAKGFEANVTSPHTSSARWPTADIVRPALIRLPIMSPAQPP